MRKKYIWLPLLLGIYFIFMAVYFGRDLLRAGQYWQFFGTAGAEVAVLVALFFSLRRRERLRREREDFHSGSEDQPRR